MSTKKTNPGDAAELRRQAEEIARKNAVTAAESAVPLSPEEAQRTLHELRVHQIELEMQKEELRRAQVELDAARARYFDLYELAPVGYCTISEPGLIVEANLTAAGLLGVERGVLVTRPFSAFIHKEDQNTYYLARKELFATGEAQALSLRMMRADRTAFWTYLEAVAAEDVDGAPLCRVAISDISERKQLEDFQVFLATTHGGAHEEHFFDTLARYLAQSLGMDFICIDRLEGDGLTAQTVSVWCDGKFEDNVSYALKDTPCGDVVGKDVCCFPASVCEFFPRDQVLQDLRAESYVGVTLWGHTGLPVGLIAVIGRGPMTNRPLAEAMLRLVAPRAAGELERLEAEAALKESEALLQAAMDQSAAGIAIADAPDGVLRYVNNAGLLIRGGDRESIVNGVGISEYVASWRLLDLDGRPLKSDEVPLARAILFGETCAREFIICGGEGDDRIVSANAAPIRDGSGRITAGIVVFTDITERKRAESVLAVRLRLMRLAQTCTLAELLRATLDEAEILTGSQSGFYHFVEPDQVTLSLQAWSTNTAANLCNAAGAPLHYAVSQAGVWADCLRERRPVIHNDYASLAHRKGLPEGHAPVLRELVVPVEREGLFVAVLGVGNKPGDYTERDVSTLTALADIAWDIAHRRRAEEALKESAARFRVLAEGAQAGTYMTDAEGNCLYVNAQWCKMAGMTEAEARGVGWLGGIHPEDRDWMAQAWRQMSETDSAWDYEYRFLSRAGTTTWVHGVAAPWRSSEGLVLGYIGTNVDITERRQAEENRAKLEAQLQEAQKMESVGRLAGGVAHDFNNMLGVILGFTEMALLQVDPALQLHEDLEEIRKAATRSADLTRQLLAFARRQTVMPRVLDLNDAVTGLFKMVQRLIGENIELNWYPGAELWPVRVDPSQVDQILANLCVNARDAMAEFGKLTVRTENRRADRDYCAGRPDFAPGEYVALSVSDDGCGMDAAAMSHIFEPFFTTKEVGKGTGLGLATVYGIVKQNEGYVEVRSAPGQGTTFTVYLPRHAGKAGEARTGAAAGPAVRGHETILLVEDEPSFLKLAASMLERLGYTVLAAGTPGAALRIARAHAGDISMLITDVIMPEMNGRDLARNLLSLYPRLKRIFMSGYTADVIAHQGVLDEGTHFIQKPFTTKELADSVRGVLDSE